MKRLFSAAALTLIAGTIALGAPASAQSRYDRHDRHDRYEQRYDRGDRYDRDDRRNYNRGYRSGWREGNRHERYDDRRHYNRGYHRGWRDRSDWRRGGYVSYNDWNRGYYVDYRRHRHLYAPPRGYEWRRVDNNYVLAAVATGLIAGLIIGGY